MIPDAALNAARNAYHDARAAPIVSDMLASALAAALPHLVTDEMVERAAGGLWDHREREERRGHVVSDEPAHEDPLWAEVVEDGLFPSGQREVRAEARAALEAALGGAA